MLIFMEKLLRYSWKLWKMRKFSPANLSPFTVYLKSNKCLKYYSESKDCKYWSFCDRGYAPTTLIAFYYTNHCYHLTRCGSISAGLKLGEHHWPEWPQTCIWPGLIAEERAPQPGMTNWFCVIAKITSNITKDKMDAGYVLTKQ